LSRPQAGDSEGFYAECMMDDMIGRLYSLVIDCPDPRALAVFYEQLLGMRRRYDKADWVAIGADGDSAEVNFQRIGDYQPPRWPDPAHPARLHVDVMVDDLDVAEAEVLALGATLLEGSDKPIGYRVYADPIGHPFCLITPESVPTHA
jgi:catechol 2,3-dioxygenase-like lactoylglutathione lyase family enzyme